MNFTSKRHLGWMTKTREERQCKPSSAAILTMHWDFLPTPQNTSGQGWTNPRYVVPLTTKLHIVTPRIFSINYCNFPLFHMKICIRSHAANRKHHITVTFTRHSRPVVLGIVLASSQPSDTYNLEMTSRFLENLLSHVSGDLMCNRTQFKAQPLCHSTLQYISFIHAIACHISFIQFLYINLFYLPKCEFFCAHLQGCWFSIIKAVIIAVDATAASYNNIY